MKPLFNRCHNDNLNTSISNNNFKKFKRKKKNKKNAEEERTYQGGENLMLHPPSAPLPHCLPPTTLPHIAFFGPTYFHAFSPDFALQPLFFNCFRKRN